MEPTMENMNSPMPQKSHGALVGSVIIILILVLGAVYLLMQNQGEREPVSDTLAGSSQTETVNLESLENELEGLDLENLDSEI